MTKPVDPYSRVYWRIVDDERFADIYGSDAHLAAWLRLLLGADQAWPASAPLPASCRRASLDALTSCGLVELRPGGLYRIHGLDAERGKRQSQAEAAAAARWGTGNADGVRQHPNSNADGDADGVPRRDETRKDEPSRDEEDAAVAFHLRTGEFPGGKMLAWINELSTTHGEARLASRINATAMEGRTPPNYLRAVRDALRAEDRLAERAEQADEEARRQAKRRPVVLREAPSEVSDEEAGRIAREYLERSRA